MKRCEDKLLRFALKVVSTLRVKDIHDIQCLWLCWSYYVRGVAAKTYMSGMKESVLLVRVVVLNDWY